MKLQTSPDSHPTMAVREERAVPGVVRALVGEVPKFDSPESQREHGSALFSDDESLAGGLDRWRIYHTNRGFRPE